ncbi:acyl-CoA dehydrogenase family protein [Paenibacillus sp. FSL R7-0337]|uniref:acyl-CoA dehydrogenase family protein n=1 Tax=Paenibacillus sp. FSL R7-0337 TaxID=1926588 RepID=UPI00096E796A|nr:acyl-CoA dehydrogenase family protein [Paenibacillus sp. FSL R7-0337]OMF98441.1 acyl-CoA dehydrogenase [Paenibacillus sp. FSL R7-0337]
MKSVIEQQRIVDEARVFADENIRPYASEFDANEALPKTLITLMGSKGYLGASLPEKYGGLGLDPIHYGYFTEVIGKACSSTRALLTVQTSLVGETLLRWGTEQQINKYLPLLIKGEKISAFALSEPNVGSDAKSVEATYRKENGKYILNGHKKWISFAGIADVFLVVAACQENISAFLVDRQSPGMKVVPMRGMLAARAAHIAEIEMQEVEVPEDHLLGREGWGLNTVVATALNHGRYSIAWAGLAIAQECLDAMVNYSRERKQFGKKIYQFQLIQGLISDAVTKVHAARAICLRAGELASHKDSEAIMETNIAKYFTSKVAMEVAMAAVQVHGGNGCNSKYPVERLFREARILEIIEGSSQIQQEIISTYGLRKYYQKNYYAK